MSHSFRFVPRLATAAMLGASLVQPVQAQTFAAPVVQLGPAPITDTANNGNGVNLIGGNSAGGAATSIVADPTTAANIWIGTANGGVWRSTDGGQSFAPLTDNQSSLSIGALALDPTSARGARTLVAGFGNLSAAGNSGGARNGLIVSYNSGTTWTPLASVGLTGLNVGAVVANGSTIVAASPDATGGVFVSINGGAKFDRVAALNGSVTGLVADPSKPGRLYAAVVPADATQSRVMMSPDNGATWSTKFSAAQSGGTITADTNSVRIAVGPTGALAIGVINNTTTPDGQQPAGIFLSGNPVGGTYNSLALPRAVTADGLVFGLNPGAQAGSNFAISVDPNNPNIIYVSGDRQALTVASETQDPIDAARQKPSSLGAKEYTATVYKIVLQADGGSLFTPLTDNFAGNNSAPHADTRAMAFTVTGQLLLGTDGGLYSRAQPNSTSGAWSGLNGGLAAIESYQAAFDPRSGRVFIAAQDNGVSGQVSPTGLKYSNLGTGDGFNASVDAKSLAADNESIVYVGTNSLTLQRIVIDAKANGQRLDTLKLMVGPASGGAVAIGAYENPPATPGGTPADLPLSSLFALNRVDPQLAVFGTKRAYTATLDPQNFGDANPSANVFLTDIAGMNGGNVTALAYGARDNTGALILAVGGIVYVSTAARPAFGTVAATGGTVGGSVNQLAFDLGNSRHFYAANGATIMGTADGGASFTNLRGNLPATFQNVNAVEYIDENGVHALFAGGSNAVANAQSPVYVSLEGALATWSAFSTGLPNALVNQLTYTPDADFLLVTTLGRGAWGVDDVTSYFPTATRLQFGFAGNDSAPIASQLIDGTDANGNAFARTLVKQGTGTLTLNVPATYTGPTTVSAGTMAAGAANVFSAVSDHTVAAGATINLAGFSQTIGSLAGAGAMTLGAGTLTTGGSGASTNFSGSILGTGGLVKTGGGVFTLSGASTYTGGTSVNVGTLALPAGSALASSVTVQSGATLATAPGSAGNGPARVAGLVTMPGSTLNVIPSAGSRPSIASSGPVTLAGSIVVTPTPEEEVPGTVLPLITGSTVTDNRALVVNGGGPLRPVADPLPGVFAIMLVRGERDLAKGPLQMAVASAIDADVLGANRDATLELSVAADTVAGQGADLRALSGVGLTAYETAAVAGARRFQNTIGAHIAGMDMGGSPARQIAMAAGAVRGGTAGGPLDPSLLIAASAYAPASLSPYSTARGRLWIEGSGAFGNLSARGDAPSVHTSGGGVVIGADTLIRPGTLAGLAVAYDTTSLGSEGLRAGAKVDAYRLSAYGRTSLGEGGPWLGASIDYSRGIARGGRQLAVGLNGPNPLVGVTTAKPNGNAVAGQVRIGQRFAVAGFDIVPTAAIQALHYDQGAFVEGGATGAELAVAGRSRIGARTVIGAAASRAFAVATGVTLTPAVSLGWAHEFADRGAVLNAAFVAGGTGFRIDGTAPGRDSALMGASATLQAGERLAVFIGYDAALARRETLQSVTGGVRLTW